MSDRTDPSALAKAAADLAAVSAVSFEQAHDALTAATHTEVEQVGVFALEAVIRGEVDEAAALIGQLGEDERLTFLGCVGTLYGITLHVGDQAERSTVAS